jgi:hypothetical protein
MNPMRITAVRVLTWPRKEEGESGNSHYDPSVEEGWSERERVAARGFIRHIYGSPETL